MTEILYLFLIYRIYSIKRRGVYLILSVSDATFIRGRCFLQNPISVLTGKSGNNTVR